MRAIILAAGRGSRMGNLTKDQPKCLAEVYGKPLIEHQISAINKAGIKDIAIVTGYKSEYLKKYGTQHFHNSRWAETNMLYSLACAKDWLEKDNCIVSYSDIFYGSHVVKELAASEEEIAIAYDPNWLTLWSKRFVNPLDDAETFRIDKRGYLLEIGQEARTIEEIQGQYMGLLKVSLSFLDHVKILEENPRISMTEYLNLILRKKKIITIPNKDNWGEFDSISDLNYA